MAYPPQHFYTPEEYLTFERASATKHEYLNGEISATGRVSARHVLLVTNLVGELGRHDSIEVGTLFTPDG